MMATVERRGEEVRDDVMLLSAGLVLVLLEEEEMNRRLYVADDHQSSIGR